MNLKTLIIPAVILCVGTLFGYAYIQYGDKIPFLNKTDNGEAQVMCTMDAMMCPDGSSVGRTGPSCEFAPCPGADANTPGATNPVACTEEALMCPDGSAVGRTGPNCSFADCPATGDVTWHFVDRGTTADDTPHTEVIATIGGLEYSLGEYVGSCGNTPQSTPLKGEISSALCWWAGAGTEIGVFKDGKDIVVKVRDVDEGTAETSGFQSKFEELLRILPTQQQNVF